MPNVKQIATLTSLLILMLNTVLAQGVDKDKHDWIKLDSVFQRFELISALNKHCLFEFKNETEPDVDLFDPSYQSIVCTIDKSQVLKLVDRYAKFCDQCDSAIKNKKEEINSFLTDRVYSIEVHYKIVNDRAVDVLALIYFKKGYIFFSMGNKDDQ